MIVAAGSGDILRRIVRASRRLGCFCGLLFVGIFADLHDAICQSPEVNVVFPAGGPQGATTTLRISGSHLQGAKGLVTGPGITVTSVSATPAGDSADVRLSVAADAPLGEREIRVWTPRGISDAVPIWVDVYPNLAEVEPNDGNARAQLISAQPVVLNGVLGSSGDRDTFAFDGRPGEAWVVDANAARIHSPASPVLELADSEGKVVAEGTPGEAGDPRIIYRCEQAGRYFIAVRGRNGTGGPGFVYRLTVGRLPVVTSVVPHGEKPGRKVAVRLEGANLAGVSRAVVSLPPDASRLVWTSVRTPNGPSLPFPLVAEFAPVVGLTETDALMPLPTLPCALEGRFSVYPSSRFAFEAKPGQTFVFDMFSRSLGSPVDSAISISDMSGTRLASSAPTTGEPRIEFTPREPGVFAVEARDRQGKIGPERTFRLTVTQAAPDFRVAADADKIEAPIRGSAKIKLILERVGGFSGEVRVSAAGLPAGVTTRGAVVPADRNEAELEFTAGPRARLDAISVVRLTAVAVVSGKNVSHAVTPRVRLPDGGYRPTLVLPLLVVDVPAR